MEGAAGKVREISGMDESLKEAIADGTIAAPELMGFNDWHVWRKTRPSKKKGDERATTTKEETELWRATMSDPPVW